MKSKKKACGHIGICGCPDYFNVFADNYYKAVNVYIKREANYLAYYIPELMVVVYRTDAVEEEHAKRALTGFIERVASLIQFTFGLPSDLLTVFKTNYTFHQQQDLKIEYLVIDENEIKQHVRLNTCVLNILHINVSSITVGNYLDVMKNSIIANYFAKEVGYHNLQTFMLHGGINRVMPSAPFDWSNKDPNEHFKTYTDQKVHGMPWPNIGAEDPNVAREFNTVGEINNLKLRITNLTKEQNETRNKVDDLIEKINKMELKKELTDMTDMIDRVSSNSSTFNVHEETAKYLDMSFNSQLKIINEASETIGRSRLPILIRMLETRTILLNAVRQSGKSTWLRSKINEMTNDEVIIISYNETYKLNVPGKENKEIYIGDFWKISNVNENDFKKMIESLRFVVIDNFRTCSKAHISQLVNAVGRINPNVIFILMY
jgi:hypothetical protein